MDHNTLLKRFLTGTNKIFKGDIAIRIWTIIKLGNEDNNVKLHGEYITTVRGTVIGIVKRILCAILQN